MKKIETKLPGVYIIEPQVFGDARGYFMETFNQRDFQEAGLNYSFVQDNQSMSLKGVLRGLHWQAAPHTQAKLVRVIRGAVWDVAVDIRAGSPTFGKFAAVTLSAENGRQSYVPRGFAHGFIVLEDDTLFSYKCDDLYDPPSERGMRYDDPAIGIPWPDLGVPPILSEKDRRHPCLADIEPWRS